SRVQNWISRGFQWARWTAAARNSSSGTGRSCSARISAVDGIRYLQSKGSRLSLEADLIEPALAEERFQAGFPPPEAAEELQRILASAFFQDVVAEGAGG